MDHATSPIIILLSSAVAAPVFELVLKPEAEAVSTS